MLKERFKVSNINPPTGDEQPRKYYASPYLDEVESLKDRIRHETAEGKEPDVSEEHALTVNEVAPELLTPEQKEYLAEIGKAEAPAKDNDGEPEPEPEPEPETDESNGDSE